MIDINLSQRIRYRHQQGEAIRSIARRLGVSRNTVRNYLRDAQHGLKTTSAVGAFKLDAGDSHKLQELYSTTGGNSVVIQRELTKHPEKYGFAAGFQISDRSIRRYFLARHPELVHPSEDPTFPFTTEPGAQLQIDFVKAKFKFAGKERAQDVFIFEATYSWSRKSFLRVCPDMTQASWLMAIAQCLAQNGIPRQILCDNDKCLVSDHPRRKDHHAAVRFHPSFLWLCKPLGICPRACLPRRAKTKGRVERFGRYVQENALAECAVNRDRIPDKAHLQKELDQWLREVADKRRRKVANGKYRTVQELYEEEKPLLSFPPQIGTTFDVTTWTTKADKDAKVYLYGVCIELPAAFASALVYVSMRANGETLVMSPSGEMLAQTPVPTQNMHDFARDDRPVAKVRPARGERKAPTKSSLLEAYTKIMS